MRSPLKEIREKTGWKTELGELFGNRSSVIGKIGAGFKWPTTASRPGQGGDFAISPEDWPDESALKEEYGYNVRIETTLSERRDSLRPAIAGLGLQKVATHIAAMVRLNKKRPDDKMKGAIQRWKEDLEWLKTEYYDQGNYRFLWPRH